MSADIWAEKLDSLDRMKSIRETNGSFDSCNSCKRLGTALLFGEIKEKNLFHVSNISSVLNFRFFLLPYLGSVGGLGG